MTILLTLLFIFIFMIGLCVTIISILGIFSGENDLGLVLLFSGLILMFFCFLCPVKDTYSTTKYKIEGTNFNTITGELTVELNNGNIAKFEKYKEVEFFKNAEVINETVITKKNFMGFGIIGGKHYTYE